MENKIVITEDVIKSLEENILRLEKDLENVTYCGSIIAIQKEIEKVEKVINRIKERKDLK